MHLRGLRAFKIFFIKAPKECEVFIACVYHKCRFPIMKSPDTS